MKRVVVIRTGTANLASVLAAFERLGCSVELTQEPSTVASAERLVLPGVGAFAAAMAELDAKSLRTPLVERVRAGRSLLAVCVGMQLLCRSSSESPEARGLGVVDGEVSRFTEALRVPQLGWNDVTAPPESRYVRSGDAYFANSYRLPGVGVDGWLAATADYGGQFVAALERDGVLACQFHPELSGPWGASLLRRWLENS